MLRLAPATLLMEDDEGSTPLDLLARAPLFEVVVWAESLMVWLGLVGVGRNP